MLYKKILLVLLLSIVVPSQTFAGSLYDELHTLPKKKVLFKLFAKNSFNKIDIEDLDRLWMEREYSTRFVVRSFEKYRRRHGKEVAPAYQEVILWHTEKDLIPASTTKEEFDYAGRLFHEKAALFGGTIRLIGGFLDNSEPYRKGLCRWTAPNTFVMLYVVRLAREPFFGPVFPMDGGTMVSQTLH